MSKAPERIWVDLEANSNGPMTAYRHIGSWPGERHEYVRADLAAAAPELLEALKVAEFVLKSARPDSGWFVRYGHVVAKAEGKA